MWSCLIVQNIYFICQCKTLHIISWMCYIVYNNAHYRTYMLGKTLHNIPKYYIAKHTIELMRFTLCSVIFAFVLACITHLPFLSQLMVGEDGTSVIYECSMMHNRHQCATLYLEDEYKNLVLEMNWTTKSIVRNASTPFGFTCVDYNEILKDKTRCPPTNCLASCWAWTSQCKGFSSMACMSLL